MRILFTCAAGLGHVFPLIPLARAAVAAGDEVLFAIPTEGIVTVEGLKFPATAIPDGDPRDIGRAWSQLPERGVNTYVVADIFVRVQALAALPALQSAIRTHRADLVVTAEFGGIVAAESCAVPNALVGITALDLADLDLTRVSDAVDDLREAAGLQRTGQPPYATGSHYLSAIPPMLWADKEHLPPGWLWYRHEDAEGPVPPTRSDLADRPPKVYATLGSMAGGNDRGRPNFAAVLTALGRLDADVLFTIGPFDPSWLGPVPANVSIAAYVPQAKAMICDIVVSHGGSGTTIAGLTRGLPMVAVPMFADQFHNADRLVAAGVGLRVDPAQVEDQLTSAITQVLQDPTYRNNARQVATDIASRPTPTQALNRIRTMLAL